jgi:TPP-dependent 2-oxoacid decarboxylase
VAGYLLTRLATESVIGHRDAEYYYDTPAWDWTALPAAVAPDRGAVTLRARTDDELAWALNAASRHAAVGRPVLIEAALGAGDVPPLVRELSRALAHR